MRRAHQLNFCAPIVWHDGVVRDVVVGTAHSRLCPPYFSFAPLKLKLPALEGTGSWARIPEGEGGDSPVPEAGACRELLRLEPGHAGPGEQPIAATGASTVTHDHATVCNSAAIVGAAAIGNGAIVG